MHVLFFCGLPGGEVVVTGDGVALLVVAPATVSSTLLGAVYVFGRDSRGMWVQNQKVSGPTG